MAKEAEKEAEKVVVAMVAVAGASRTTSPGSGSRRRETDTEGSSARDTGGGLAEDGHLAEAAVATVALRAGVLRDKTPDKTQTNSYF